jgi:SAM-dependent methyltransferase
MNYNWINTKVLDELNKQKIILFGAGKGSEEFLEYSEKSKLRNEVVCIADNDPTYWGHDLQGYKIIPPEKIGNQKFDKIIVTSISGRETIAHQLEGMGFTQGRDYILAGRYPSTYRGNFENFLKNLPLKPELNGARCLHIGPGGFLGIEVLLYCLGAEKVYSIDRLTFGIDFPDITKSSNDYMRIKKNLNTCLFNGQSRLHALERFKKIFFQKDAHLYIDRDRIEYIWPMDVCDMAFAENSFELVLSFAVLEHVHDPASAVSKIARVLKPGSLCFHTVVTQDHRSFSKVSDYTPFSFRSHDPASWENITRKRFYQNRLLPVEWKNLFEENGLKVVKYGVMNNMAIDDEIYDSFHEDFKKFSRMELGEVNCCIAAIKE